jgi:hypothetical protein
VFARVWRVRLEVLVLSAAVAGIFLSAAAGEAAGAPIDVRGTYEAAACTSGTLAECEAHPQYPQKYVLETEDFTTGALTGKGFSDACAPIYTITGTISGNAVKFHTVQSGYTSDAVLTSNPEGTKLTGTFSDSYGRVNDPTFGNRIAGFPCGGGTSGEEEAAKKAKEAKEKEEAEKASKHPTGTSIVCNYEFATSQNTCVASVGDGSALNPTGPTGTVTFTTTSGGFSSGAKCSLTVNPSSPTVSNCSLVYQTAESGLPSITATYGGDATHAGSIGHTEFLGTGSGDTTGEAPTGAPGQYPNEVVLNTDVPIAGTTVEAAVQGLTANPAPVPLVLPKIDPSLDPISAGDLGLVEKDAQAVDVTAGQNANLNAQMNLAITQALAQAEALSKSTNPADQARGALLLSETLRAIDALRSMDRSLQRSLESLNKFVQAQSLWPLGAAARKPRITSVKSLAYLVRHNVPAGKLRLGLRLNRAALNRLAGKHNSITLNLRVNMILPSKLIKGGLPRMVVERITLKKTAAAKGHRHRKKH